MSHSIRLWLAGALLLTTAQGGGVRGDEPPAAMAPNPETAPPPGDPAAPEPSGYDPSTLWRRFARRPEDVPLAWRAQLPDAGPSAEAAPGTGPADVGSWRGVIPDPELPIVAPPAAAEPFAGYRAVVGPRPAGLPSPLAGTLLGAGGPGPRGLPASSFLPGWRSDGIARLGWWFGGTGGSPTMVGEYQGLTPSPFVDLDGIGSDGRTTVDFWGSVLNSGASDFRGYLYRDGFRADARFEEFPHRFPFEPIIGGPVEGANQVVEENLSVGEDYAVRVQQLNASFRGPLAKNLTWKVKVFAFHKFGDRQANSMAHCFNVNLVGGPADNRCHVVTQRQQIDWMTMEVEPGLEAKFRRVTLDYSRTMRQFTANDQVVYAPYNRFGAFGGGGSFATIYPYALVPNTMFEMDRLKVGVDLSPTTRLYSYLYQGDMANQSRETNRQFYGFDTRLIRTTPRGITAVAYAKYNVANNEWPPFLLPEERDDPSQILHPVNYYRFWTGLDGQWYPWRESATVWRGMSFRANYEYHTIARQYATWPLNIPADYVTPAYVTDAQVRGDAFTQPTTVMNTLNFQQRMQWNPAVITFAKYRVNLTANPLFGVQTNSGTLNSNLPTADQTFALGGSWSPRPNLVLSAQAELQNAWLVSPYANFSQNNFPVLATAWYAPTDKLSFSGGYSFYSDWINQDITLGYRGAEEPPPAETLRFGYNGETHVVNAGARYAWTERLLLNGGVFYVDGTNVFDVPPSRTGADWSQMPLYADVRAESIRYQFGFDYTLSDRLGCYFRTNVFDYKDLSRGLNSGTAYFFLAGLSGTY
jgi:hypothetical protein